MFSIIIPTCDRPGFLRRALASIETQSFRDFEIIVVNDGGQSIDAAARILDNDQRGPIAARNLGVANAFGDLIAFLDDDDWWIDSDHLASAAAALATAPFHFANGTMVFADGSPEEPFRRTADAASLQQNNTILISTVCYHKSLHRQLGAFDESLPYYWDWDWYLRIARSGATLHHDTRPVAAIQVHAGNMSGARMEAERAANLAMLGEKHGLKGLTLKNHLMIARERKI